MIRPIAHLVILPVRHMSMAIGILSGEIADGHGQHGSLCRARTRTAHLIRATNLGTRAETASWYLTAQAVCLVEEGQVSISLSFRYDRPIAALVWA